MFFFLAFPCFLIIKLWLIQYSDFTYEVRVPIYRDPTGGIVPGHVGPRPDEDEATRMCEQRGLDYFTIVETRFYFICQTTLQGFGWPCKTVPNRKMSQACVS